MTHLMWENENEIIIVEISLGNWKKNSYEKKKNEEKNNDV